MVKQVIKFDKRRDPPVFARSSRLMILIMSSLCAVLVSVNGALCQELLVKGVPYVVQKAHLD